MGPLTILCTPHQVTPQVFPVELGHSPVETRLNKSRLMIPSLYFRLGRSGFATSYLGEPFWDCDFACGVKRKPQGNQSFFGGSPQKIIKHRVNPRPRSCTLTSGAPAERRQRVAQRGAHRHGPELLPGEGSEANPMWIKIQQRPGFHAQPNGGWCPFGVLSP